MNVARQRPLVAVGITLLLALTVLALPVSYVGNKHQWAQDKLAELEPRYARLAGLAAVSDQLEKGAAQADAALARFAYASSLDISQAGNDAQQRARRAIEDAGMSVSSSQVLPAQPEEGFDRIAVAVRAEGTLPQVQAALAALADASPALGLDLLSLRGTGGSQRLACQFTLHALRLRP